ncbi:hypothetical protein KPH14_009906 [Odynerus spinipes]|uniref:Uncharacterized protein n=1 Tax=Odynerus spinipes TaxID=1348599 RepID=A0AAD9VSJ7_9HYME|nr:hypothetical protein KPH14_009906 [Odynerus spinipes]
MIKYVLLCGALACLAHAQRPPYAGSSNRYPVVLPQYLETAAPSVGNRIDSENKDTSATSGTIYTSTLATTTTTIPADLPVDALGDIDLINRIKTWPRDKQPFWFINWQQLEAHRNPNGPRGTRPPPMDSKSLFQI